MCSAEADIELSEADLAEKALNAIQKLKFMTRQKMNPGGVGPKTVPYGEGVKHFEKDGWALTGMPKVQQKRKVYPH